MKSTIEHPKVFISYAWGSEDYRSSKTSIPFSIKSVAKERTFNLESSDPHA